MRSTGVMSIRSSEVKSILSVDEARLQLAQKIAALGSWEYNLESKTLWGSEEYFKIFGLPVGPRETTFNEIDSLVNDIDYVKNSMFDLIAKNKKFDIEYSCTQKNTGKSIIVRSIAQAIKNDEGHVTKVFGTLQYLSDQRNNFELLKQSEKKYQSIVEAAVDLIFTTNLHGEVIFVNKSSSIRIAPTVNELAWFFFPEKYIDLILKKFDYVISTGSSTGMEFQKLTSKNSLWFHTIISPIMDGRKVTAVTFTTRDITIVKTNEKIAYDRQLTDLEKTKNELDQFAYSISHDLRAPVATVLGLLNLSKLENSQNNIADLGTLIRESMEKLERTINGMSEYFHNLRSDLQPEKIDFKKLIHDLETDIERSEEIQLQISVNDKSPFYSDVKRLRTIFFHLWTNSIVFKTRFNPYLKIKIKTSSNQANIIFEDNGIGIDDDHVHKIFQMFYRGSVISKGSGLGLSIVNEMVDKLKGTISVRSELSKYSIFKITLPNLNNVELSNI